MRAHAAWALLRLARRMVERRNVPQPELLVICREQPEARSHLMDLWRVALTQPATAFVVWDALAAWLLIVGDDDQLRDEVTELVTQIWNTPPLRIRARFHLERRWRSQIPNPALLDQLAINLKEA